MTLSKPGPEVVEDSGTSIPSFTGEVFRPGTPAYELGRMLFNGIHNRRPALIARCTCSADVAAVVDYARNRSLGLSVFGGGHGVTGSAVADGAVCLDLRGMKTITIDPLARVAVVDAGCTWAELDAASQEHGLAVTGGRVSTTGVGGLALGSGSGWLERSLGFTCDSLLAAELVTADGRTVAASEEENPDLFWGIRGGGGNFGVVTRFTLRLHPVGPMVLAGMLMYPAGQAAAVLRHYRDFMSTAPDAVGAGVAFITAPPADFVPEPVRGEPVVGVVVCYNGPVEEGQRVLAPLLAYGPPAVSMVQPMPYVAFQQIIDGANPHGMRNYWTADFYRELPDEAVQTLVAAATKPVSPLTQIMVVAAGGAIARVPEEATAFGNRSASFGIHYLSMWEPADQDAVNIGYTKSLLAAMKPWAAKGVYLNFIGDEGRSRVESAFGPVKWARLQELKRTWDPDNVFRNNQNIPPQ